VHFGLEVLLALDQDGYVLDLLLHDVVLLVHLPDFLQHFLVEVSDICKSLVGVPDVVLVQDHGLDLVEILDLGGFVFQFAQSLECVAVVL